MKFYADLHIHSKYSMATSKTLTPEYLDYFGKIKGVQLIGTGDLSHPGWIRDMKKKLVSNDNGLYKLKDELVINENPELLEKCNKDVNFILSGEISSVYKKDGKVRKVHNIILAPDFETVDKIQKRLDAIGNIHYDGRPILGLDSKNLLEIVLEANEKSMLIPAHIWTPWFSALGSKSGFDDIKDCFEDLTKYIYAVETGLSTDPAMNWLIKSLDRYTLLSNSDAHSPDKLGRNANIFNCDMNYDSITNALKDQKSDEFIGTVDMYPQEGKYHYDGHRKCKVQFSPLDSIKHNDICPVCNKPVVIGVMNRVAELATRDNCLDRPNRKVSENVIPLKEILSEICGVGPNTKTVLKRYNEIIGKFGSEMELLLNIDLKRIKEEDGPILFEAVRRMRNRKVNVIEGFDGEFGIVKCFSDEEKALIKAKDSKLEKTLNKNYEKKEVRPLINFDVKEYNKMKNDQLTMNN